MKLSAEERFLSILRDRQVRAFRMFQTPDPVVCFTECTRSGVEHLFTQRVYAPYGLAFSKDFVFGRGGGPALYVRGDDFHAVEQLPARLRAMCIRYWPGVDHFAGAIEDSLPNNLIDRPSDWIHERAWRLPCAGEPPSFDFGLEDVEFAIVPEGADDRLMAELLPGIFIFHVDGDGMLKEMSGQS